MKAAPIVAELAGLGIRQFGGALDYAALRSAPPPGSMPACFVTPEGSSAGDSRLAGVVDQRVADTWMCVLLLDAAARRTDALDDRLDDLARSVRDRLVGWTHPQASGPTLYAGGRLLSIADGLIAWGERFSAPFHIPQGFSMTDTPDPTPAKRAKPDDRPTQPRPTDAAGRILDTHGLPIAGPARVAALAGKPDPALKDA